MSSSKLQENKLQNYDLLLENNELIKLLEEDISDMNSLMIILHNHIQEQQHYVDNIESNIEKSIQHTGKAVIELSKAEDNLRKSTCIII